VLTAQTTLQAAQAQAVDVLRTRSALEHAIAVLVGEPPSKLTITPLPVFNLNAPEIPVGVPSTLLERRPDVAAAERTMAAANAQIGVNIAGFFPDLSLSGQDGYSASALSQLFNAASNSWSIGGTLTQTVFDAGATQGRVRAAKGLYKQNVANYRQRWRVCACWRRKNSSATRPPGKPTRRRSSPPISTRPARWTTPPWWWPRPPP
jgi:outer membrane protein TolC